ncbi:MAG TPA: urease accessory protein [Methylophaga sp.]|nr:urease accessory protein [Methylophaga sp.]
MNPLNSLAEDVPSGWLAQLDLEFSHRSDKTVLSHRSQRGPLHVQRPFYPEGDVCHLYILHPPGGVVGGDTLTINTTIHANASTLLTTPGATKFYRSQGQTAHQKQFLKIADHASLEWMPQENIYFPGAQARMSTQIDLAPNARFIGWETHCLGLPVNNETFTTGQLNLDFLLRRDGVPLLMERMHINAEKLNSPTGLRGHAVMAMLVATPANNELLEQARSTLQDTDNHLIAATLIEDCLVIRYLGNSTAQCRKLFTQIWTELRPAILQRKACPPRIWAT